MSIYRFSEPYLPSGAAQRHLEGDKPNVGIPGVNCDLCRKIWATSLSAIRVDLPPDHYLWDVRYWPKSPEELNVIRSDVRKALNLASNYSLPPGTEVCLRRVNWKRGSPSDFEYPVINQIIISERAAQFIEANKITGVEIFPVVVTQWRKNEVPPNLFEMRIVGQGGIPSTDPPRTVTFYCPKCERTEYNVNFKDRTTDNFKIDESDGDGRDFFRLSAPFDGHVFVSERGKALLEASPLTNYSLRELNDALRGTPLPAGPPFDFSSFSTPPIVRLAQN